MEKPEILKKIKIIEEDVPNLQPKAIVFVLMFGLVGLDGWLQSSMHSE